MATLRGLVTALGLLLAAAALRTAPAVTVGQAETALARHDPALPAAAASLYDVSVPDFPGKAEYDAARGAIGRGDLAAAAADLARAVRRNPELTEAWYNLGAVQARLAVASAGVDDRRALALLRDAAAAKRRAAELMVHGEFRVWLTTAEREQARRDLEQGLAGIDALLGDDGAAIAALEAQPALVGG